jgi:hypothetical protein
MDLLAQYSDGSGGAASDGGGEEEVAKAQPSMISKVIDTAPYVNTACMALVNDAGEQRIVNVADTQNLHGEHASVLGGGC